MPQRVDSPLPGWETLREPSTSSRATSEDERPSVRTFGSQGQPRRQPAQGNRDDGGGLNAPKRRHDGVEGSEPMSKKPKVGRPEGGIASTLNRTEVRPSSPHELPSAAPSNASKPRTQMRKPAGGNHPRQPQSHSQASTQSGTAPSQSISAPGPSSRPKSGAGREQSVIDISDSGTELPDVPKTTSVKKKSKGTEAIASVSTGKSKVPNSRKGKEKARGDHVSSDESQSDDAVRIRFGEQQRRASGQVQPKGSSNSRKSTSSAPGSRLGSVSAMAGSERSTTRPKKRFQEEKERRKTGNHTAIPRKDPYGIRATASTSDVVIELSSDDDEPPSNSLPSRLKVEPEVIEILDSDEDSNVPQPALKEPVIETKKEPQELITISDDDEIDLQLGGGMDAAPSPPAGPALVTEERVESSKSAPDTDNGLGLDTTAMEVGMDVTINDDGGGGTHIHLQGASSDVEMRSASSPPVDSLRTSKDVVMTTSPSKPASALPKAKEQSIPSAKGMSALHGSESRSPSKSPREEHPKSGEKLPILPKALPTVPRASQSPTLRSSPSSQTTHVSHGDAPSSTPDDSVQTHGHRSSSYAPDPPPSSSPDVHTPPTPQQPPAPIPVTISELPLVTESTPRDATMLDIESDPQPSGSHPPSSSTLSSEQTMVTASIPAPKSSSRTEPTAQAPNPDPELLASHHKPTSSSSQVQTPASISAAVSKQQQQQPVEPTVEVIKAPNPGAQSSSSQLKPPSSSSSSSEQRRGIRPKSRKSGSLSTWAENEERKESQRKAVERTQPHRILLVARKTTGGRPPKPIDAAVPRKQTARKSTGGMAPPRRARVPPSRSSPSSSPSPSPADGATHSWLASMTKAFDDAGKANAPTGKTTGKTKESVVDDGNTPQQDTNRRATITSPMISPLASRTDKNALRSARSKTISQMKSFISPQPPLPTHVPTSSNNPDSPDSSSDDFAAAEARGRAGWNELISQNTGAWASAVANKPPNPPSTVTNARTPDFDMTQDPTSEEESDSDEDVNILLSKQKWLNEIVPNRPGSSSAATKAGNDASSQALGSSKPSPTGRLSSELAHTSQVNDNQAPNVDEESDELEYLNEVNPRSADDVLRERESLEELVYPEGPGSENEPMAVDDTPKASQLQERTQDAAIADADFHQPISDPPPSPTPSASTPQVPVLEEELTGRAPRSSSASSGSSAQSEDYPKQLVLRRSARNLRPAVSRRSSSADVLNLTSTPTSDGGKPSSYGGLPVINWESYKEDLTNFQPEWNKSADLGHIFQDHMNYLAEATRNNEETGHVLESIILENTSEESHAPIIRIVPLSKLEPTPPWEFYYTNKMYHDEGVPPPSVKNLKGCGCIGKCVPETCACAKRQGRLTSTYQTGFLYDNDRCLKQTGLPVLECNSLCRCDDDCMNRVVQNGRKVDVSIHKTALKGWGVMNNGKKKIRCGQFIGVYSGEYLLTDKAEERGKYYNKFGRTYLFDCDLFYMKEPHGLLPVKDFDKKKKEGAGCRYTIDAYHAGNFTRFLNHSCDPNSDLAYVYIDEDDLWKPLLCLFARRDIAIGEELTFSYSGPPDNMADGSDPEDSDVESSPKKKFSDTVYQKCHCGAGDLCRGFLFR
ncbi:hypothetical protein PM082_008341 [Marasmius tenuissimus]|nr:hypothetical protein PM082_008341 [Marasmius tenuissimus]